MATASASASDSSDPSGSVYEPSSHGSSSGSSDRDLVPVEMNPKTAAAQALKTDVPARITRSRSALMTASSPPPPTKRLKTDVPARVTRSRSRSRSRSAQNTATDPSPHGPPAPSTANWLGLVRAPRTPRFPVNKAPVDVAPVDEDEGGAPVDEDEDLIGDGDEAVIGDGDESKFEKPWVTSELTNWCFGVMEHGTSWKDVATFVPTKNREGCARIARTQGDEIILLVMDKLPHATEADKSNLIKTVLALRTPKKQGSKTTGGKGDTAGKGKRAAVPLKEPAVVQEEEARVAPEDPGAVPRDASNSPAADEAELLLSMSIIPAPGP